MKLNDDELKYKEVISALKSLSRVSAPENFDIKLIRRINSGVEKKENFWDKIFSSSKLIPSTALAVSLVALVFILNINSGKIEDPLLIEPKMREEVVNADNMLVIYLPLNRKQRGGESRYSGSSNSSEERAYIPQQVENNLYFPNDYFPIDKNGLNFIQVNLTPEEQQNVNRLKERFRTLLKNNVK